MATRTRVPFSWTQGDVRASAGPRIGERFSVHVDVDEGRWRDDHFALEVVKEAIHAAVQRMLYEDAGTLHATVVRLLRSEAFVRPILEDEIRKAARAHAAAIFGLGAVD